MGEALKLVEDTREPSLVVCPPNDLKAWLVAEPYIQRALEHTDEWQIGHVADAYISGRVGLALMLDQDRVPFGAIVFEILTYPAKRAFQVHIGAAGPHTEETWVQLQPAVADLARELGASSIMGTGRDGWPRKLKQLGFEIKTRYLWEMKI